MSPSTITLLFLAFAIVSFILEKIPLGLTATIVAIGLNLTGVLSNSDTFAGYVNSNVILCVGMLLWARPCLRPAWPTRSAAWSPSSPSPREC